ncbi:putative peptide maturation dehydrogenase [Xanthomonas sp. NCPPB 3582]|uniref:putative peptide maturation dehydrogenase n=1 Tax=Xanthomonas sp. NCPPB 3582 TaxID=487557 RepID=UPI003555E387
MKIKRRELCFFQIQDNVQPDLSGLLRGEVRLTQKTTVTLLCPINGERIPLTAEELHFIASLPVGWTEVATPSNLSISGSSLSRLVRLGILISDDTNDGRSIALAASEELCKQIGWHPLAQLYHSMTRWSDKSTPDATEDMGKEHRQAQLTQHAAIHGPIPTHFPDHPGGLGKIALPEPADYDTFDEVLLKRKTTRHFDTSRALPESIFGTILHRTFGAMGTEDLAPGMTAIKRTSPSGGSLHPIEAYPLVMNVEGLKPGLYHYESSRHHLNYLKPMSLEEARRTAKILVIGQTYFSDAAALVFHVARLDRHHWKYRNHPKAYRAVTLDSGHLSQTFYLLGSHLGLGTFYTAAINDANLEELLCLDNLKSMVVGANGVGIIDESQNSLHLSPTRMPKRATV